MLKLFFSLLLSITNHINTIMKTSTRIISMLATAIIGLTLSSCGGGGGGGGGGSKGGDKEQQAANNQGAGNNQGATSEKDYAPTSKTGFSSITFAGYSFTPTSVKASHLSSVNLGYSYKKTGKNQATISVYGKQTQDFQASATLSNGRFQIQNYRGVVVFEVEAEFTVTFVNDKQIKVIGNEERTRYSYTTRILNLIKTGESTDSSSYNTTGSWK